MVTELENRSFPSASMTEMTSDVLGDERLEAFLTGADRGVRIDAVGDVAAVRHDAATAGSCSWFTAIISTHRNSPSARRSRAVIVSLVPGVARSFWNISPRSATSSGHMRLPAATTQ